MWDACRLLWSLLIGLFRSRASLEAENLALRQQIIVLRRTASKRLSFNALDRLIFVGLHRVLGMPWLWSGRRRSFAGTVLGSEPIGVGSRGLAGRPTVPLGIRQLIREMSLANPLWGARSPWRTAQTRHCYRTDECSEWDGPAVLPPLTAIRAGGGFKSTRSTCHA